MIVALRYHSSPCVISATVKTGRQTSTPDFCGRATCGMQSGDGAGMSYTNRIVCSEIYHGFPLSRSIEVLLYTVRG